MRLWSILLAFCCLCASKSALATPAPTFHVYIDADYSIAANSAQAIEDGMRTALAEVNNRIGGIEIALKPMDHRGNSKRSRMHMQTYLKDVHALAIFGGMHSPPYLSNRLFINEAGILTLLPWSAAGPITRSSKDVENWIFRLSVDDSKAGRFLVHQAARYPECEKIGLALVDTGWGRSNKQPMTNALAELGKEPSKIVTFSTELGQQGADRIVSELAEKGTDCVIMLANIQGAVLIKAMAEQIPGGRVFSHWGITGGNFTNLVDHSTRKATRLRVLQTCGLRAEQNGSPVLRNIFQNTDSLSQLSDSPAPAGFVHGYDLTKLFIAAIEQASKSAAWTTDIADKRKALRSALENLREPVAGILRTYQRPYEVYSPANPDAHEALGAGDLCMASYAADGRIVHTADD